MEIVCLMMIVGMPTPSMLDDHLAGFKTAARILTAFILTVMIMAVQWSQLSTPHTEILTAAHSCGFVSTQQVVYYLIRGVGFGNL
jgi:hypothetical protein